MKTALAVMLAAAGLVAIALAAAIAFGTSAPPPALASIGSPFEKVDFSDLPPAETLPARDSGGTIAFRHWTAQAASEPEITLIAIHGSSASSHSMHPLAKALAALGIEVYAPDIRGHGATGRRGDIDYAGQLDDDLEDFTAAISRRHPGARPVLLGFSSGGGFALHAAASRYGGAFERAVLIAPMLGHRAPTMKANPAKWAAPFIPRIIGLLALNRAGIHAFDGLPVITFAIPPARANVLTASYSFRLLQAFGTADYAADLKNARTPLAVAVGGEDELFHAGRFPATVKAVRPDVPVAIAGGLNHIGMVTDPRAIPVIAAAVRGRLPAQ